MAVALAAREEPPATAAAQALPAAERLTLLFWGGFLLLLLYTASPYGGLIGIPGSFFLKNNLHLGAHPLPWLNLWTRAPPYLSFVLGLLRDPLSTLGLG